MNFKDKLEAAYYVCNEMNKRWRWIKFYVDKDLDIAAQVDAVITDATCGAVCLELVQRAVSIIDDAYPEFVKAHST